MTNQKHVVIVGGGFGGLHLAKSLKSAPVRITLIDRRNFHLFQPLLYQVATGGLSPANIASPLRGILRRQKNVSVVLDEVTGFDLEQRRVLLGERFVGYDTLVVAAGSSHSYFGHDEWEAFAPGLKTVEDATEIRRRVLMAFEAAEVETDPVQRDAWMTFVIVGGGPTGVELAGSLSELARHTLRIDFRNIDPRNAKLILVDAVDRLLTAYPEDLSAKSAATLESLGVTIRFNTKVTGIQCDHVEIQSDSGTERIPTRTVIWAAGVQASPLAKYLADGTGAAIDRSGRISVEPDLSLKGQPDVFVIGDMASLKGPDGQPLPGVAPVAIQQGRYVADLIRSRVQGKPSLPFRYRDRGTMATIGRSAAVAVVGKRHLSGFVAWLMWLFVHLLQLVQYQNRLLVLFQWAWNYTTWNRSARLITGTKALLQIPDDDADCETDLAGSAHDSSSGHSSR